MLFPFALSAAIIVIGILIGCLGIGGVLLVPALRHLGDVAIHVAIPACSLSYLVTGTVGAVIYARHGTIDWDRGIRVCLGALPGAFLGAALLPYIPDFVLGTGIALLILLSGLHTLIASGARYQTGRNAPVMTSGLLLIGLLTGTGSALTGTGGPLLLVPVLLWFRIPILTAIGLSQVIQIPIALLATAGNALYGQIDFSLSAGLVLLLAVGSLVGARLAHVVPADYLKKGVALVMVLLGTALLFSEFPG